MVQTVSRRSDDRVLTYTRILSLFILPFLLVAFVLLYLFPGSTTRLFAWTITPTMTPMMLGAAYLGGAYFFLRVLRASRWSAISTGFISVALFASLLGVATILHWDRFNHTHPAFWVWAGLYFTAPWLVIGAWVANRATRSRTDATTDRLGTTARWAVALVGLLALGQGLFMVVLPERVIPLWPWALTPLTCRVVGAVFCLGAAGLVTVIDARWTTLRLMVQVAVLMLVLIVVGVLRALGEFDTSRPLTWLLLIGALVILAGSLRLWVHQEGGMRVRSRG